MKSKEISMVSGPIFKSLLVLTLPIMISTVLASVFNIIDMTMLKQFHSGNGYAVGAVGVCGPLITLITGVFTGCSTGVNVATSKRLGKGDKELIDRVAGTSLLLFIVLGVFLMIVGILGAKTFLIMVNCDELLLDDATLYFKLYFLGFPLSMVYTACAAILRASGDARRLMIYSILSSFLKIIFTLIFVAVFKMGIVGLALATIVTWVILCVLGLIALTNGSSSVRIKFKKLRFYKEELKDILIVGIPTGIQTGLYSYANVIISSAVNSYGPDATTGISIANTFDGILYNISIAPATAMLAYVSQNIGAGNLERAKKAMKDAMLISFMFGSVLGGLSALLSGQLSSIMSDKPEIIAYSQQKMVLISSTYFLCGIERCIGSALKGLGRPVVPMVTTMLFMCLIRFPWVYFVFPLVPSLTFLYLIWPIGWVLSSLSMLGFLFSAIKQTKIKLQKKAEMQEAA